MKIYVPNTKKLRGPYIFCRRLYKAIVKIPDVEIVDPSSCSVQLHSVLLRDVNPKAKHVLRLDGVYHHVGPEYDWRKNNVPIKESFDFADGVVYQSHFSKKLCEKYLGKTSVPYEIIYNGANPNTYTFKGSIISKDRPFFLTAANWRPFKRLEDTIESFLMSGLERVDLVIAGDTKRSGISEEKVAEYKKNPNIKFLGKVSQEELISYYVQCLALIHISWIDNCPNSVVEAICAGKPVICGNIGGTNEIVRESGGLVLNIEDDYDLEPRDLYHPPSIDRSLVVGAMYKCFNHDFSIKNSHVDIRNTAIKYLEFFRKILYSGL